MKLLINFGNRSYYHSQKINSQSGLLVGGFDQIIQYTPKEIDKTFLEKNQNILSQKRGAGYWLWKPYFIQKALATLQWGDYLFYCDAGAHFIASISPLIEICESSNQDIIVFELELLERAWTKRDALVLMDADIPEMIDTPQRIGGYHLWKKTPFSEYLVQEWLNYAQDERIISDCLNQLGQPNYPEFQNHRHDQSILSLLTKRHKIPAHRNPSQWGNPFMAQYPRSNYGQLIQGTRRRDNIVQRSANYIHDLRLALTR
jgi:hypothetical protein